MADVTSIATVTNQTLHQLYQWFSWLRMDLPSGNSLVFPSIDLWLHTHIPCDLLSNSLDLLLLQSRSIPYSSPFYSSYHFATLTLLFLLLRRNEIQERGPRRNRIKKKPLTLTLTNVFSMSTLAAAGYICLFLPSFPFPFSFFFLLFLFSISIFALPVLFSPVVT